MICESVVKRLNAKQYPLVQSYGNEKYYVFLTMKPSEPSNQDENISHSVGLAVMSNSDKICSEQFPVELIKSYATKLNISLSDNDEGMNSGFEMLIGNDLIGPILLMPQQNSVRVPISNGGLFFVPTNYGWTVQGFYNSEKAPKSFSTEMNTFSPDLPRNIVQSNRITRRVPLTLKSNFDSIAQSIINHPESSLKNKPPKFYHSIIKACIYRTNQSPINVNVLLDSGSHTSFISLKLVKRLALLQYKIQPLQVDWTLLNKLSQIEHKVELKLHSVEDPNVCTQMKLYVESTTFEKLLYYFPRLTTKMIETANEHNISLNACPHADDEASPHQKCDILIGQDWLWQGFLLEQQKSVCVPGTNVAFVQTRFGWIVQGKADNWIDVHDDMPNDSN